MWRRDQEKALDGSFYSTTQGPAVPAARRGAAGGGEQDERHQPRHDVLQPRPLPQDSLRGGDPGQTFNLHKGDNIHDRESDKTVHCARKAFAGNPILPFSKASYLLLNTRPSSIHDSYSYHVYKSRTNEGTFTHLYHHQNCDANTHLKTILMIFLHRIKQGLDY